MANLPGNAVPDRAVRLPRTHLVGAPGIVFLPDEGPLFRLRLTPQVAPAGTGAGAGATDDAPRTHDRAALLVRKRTATGAPLDIVSGDWLRVTSREPTLADDWELSGPLRPIRGAKVLVGYEGDATRVSSLYPDAAQLEELGGVVVEAGIPVAVYPVSDERTVAGGLIVDWTGEAPYSYLPELMVTNRQLRVAGRVFKIVEATPHHYLPRVALRLREGRDA